MAASPARRRERIAVLTDAAFVVAFLVSVVAALLAALPVLQLWGPQGGFDVAEFRPTGSYPGDPIVVDRTLLWPHASVTWTSGEVTSYTADWRFVLPLLCIAVWLALAVHQSRRDDEPARPSATDDTVTLPAVGR